MQFNLVVDIDDEYISDYLRDNGISFAELKGRLNNACYLGLDCTNAIIERQFGFGPSNTYVEK
jgi:hypothetical protein